MSTSVTDRQILRQGLFDFSGRREDMQKFHFIFSLKRTLVHSIGVILLLEVLAMLD